MKVVSTITRNTVPLADVLQGATFTFPDDDPEQVYMRVGSITRDLVTETGRVPIVTLTDGTVSNILEVTQVILLPNAVVMTDWSE